MLKTKKKGRGVVESIVHVVTYYEGFDPFKTVPLHIESTLSIDRCEAIIFKYENPGVVRKVPLKIKILKFLNRF
jgi:hypothetical protein